MMDENKKITERPYFYSSVSVGLAALACAVVGYFVLPDKIFVQLLEQSNSPETSTLLFVIAGAVITNLCTAMCLFTDKVKKWFALQVVIAIAFVGCLVYNLIVI